MHNGYIGIPGCQCPLPKILWRVSISLRLDMNEWYPSCSLPVLTVFLFWRFAFLARHNPQNDSPSNWNSSVKYDHRASLAFAHWALQWAVLLDGPRLYFVRVSWDLSPWWFRPHRCGAMNNNRDRRETICLSFNNGIIYKVEDTSCLF